MGRLNLQELAIESVILDIRKKWVVKNIVSVL
jgi:hypothetical protein